MRSPGRWPASEILLPTHKAHWRRFILVRRAEMHPSCLSCAPCAVGAFRWSSCERRDQHLWCISAAMQIHPPPPPRPPADWMNPPNLNLNVTDGPTDELRAALKDKKPWCQSLLHQAVIQLKTALTNYQAHKSGSFSQVWQGSSISCVILRYKSHTRGDTNENKKEQLIYDWA